jgi:hypothetical protein
LKREHLFRFNIARNKKNGLRSSVKVSSIFVALHKNVELPDILSLRSPISNLTKIHPTEAAMTHEDMTKVKDAIGDCKKTTKQGKKKKKKKKKSFNCHIRHDYSNSHKQAAWV